jgi:hypothetical protein
MFPKLMMKKAMISCEEAFVQIGQLQGYVIKESCRRNSSFESGPVTNHALVVCSHDRRFV